MRIPDTARKNAVALTLRPLIAPLSGALFARMVSFDASQLIPLREVMDENYVAYFYTAGTKPPQPAVHYCPHSQGGVGEKALHHHDHHDHGSSGGEGGDDDEDRLITAGPPPTSPRNNGRGVRWQVTPSGQMMSVMQE